MASAVDAAGLGDFNDDGKADLLLRHQGGAWRYLALDGGRVVDGASGAADLPADPGWQGVGLGDYDGDGNSEVLLRHADGRWYRHAMAGRSSIRSGRGATNFTGSARWAFVAVADLDGDGRDGVLLRNVDHHGWHYYTVAERRAWVGTGPVDLTRDPDWEFRAAGDLNGDGKDDILLRRPRDGHWHYYPMNGRSRIAADEGEAGIETEDDYRLAGVGDIDGDGKDDILLRHGSGRWHYRLMDGRHSDEARRGVVEAPADWDWSLIGGSDQWDGVDIPDAPLRAAIAQALGAFEDADGDEVLDAGERTRPITPRDMSRLEHLLVSAAGVRDLDGLQFADNLTYLYLDANDVADLSPLSGLTELGLLFVRANAISDLGPLATLANLSELWIQDNAITDLSPLADLSNLTHVRLDGNAIGDLSPLAGLTGLTLLGLDHNDIEDLQPLAGLSSLTELHLDANRISDLSPLRALANLTVLGLDHNDIVDIDALRGLGNLTDLYLRANRIADLSPLARLTNLTYLYLDANAIVGIDPLAMLDPHHVSLAGNHIRDIRPLARTSFTHNPVLDLGSNDIADISPLRGIYLWRLDLAANDIRDISALAWTPDLEHLAIEGNPITDLSPLRHLTRLETLSLGGGPIGDFTALQSLAALKSLSISDTAVADLGALDWPDRIPAEAVALGSLDLLNTGTVDLGALSNARFATVRNLALRGNGLGDASAISGMAKLESLDLADNAIEDLAGLANLDELTYLSIANNPVADIAPLAELPALRSLVAQGTDITDLGAAADLADLHEIRLDDARLADVAALARLRGSEAGRRYGLYLARNAIADLAPLTAITDLGHGDVLRVDGNPLDAAAVDEHIPALRARGASVYVSGDVDIRDATLRERIARHLGRLPAEPLAADEMLALTTLVAPADPFWWRWDIAYAPIRDLTGIDAARNLARLNLDGQRIVDVSALAALTELADVRLNYNRIVDIGPLAANPGLGAGDIIRLRGNPLNDESIKTHLPALRARGVVVHHRGQAR